MNPDNPPVSPAEIIEFILEEMRAETLDMRYSNLVRSVYHVYLNSNDMRRLGPVLQRTKADAIRALNEELASLNKPKFRVPGFSTNQKRYEIIGDNWLIEFHENTDDDAEENPLIVQSEFAPPPISTTNETDDRVGTDTVRITKRQASGLTTTTTETVRSADYLNRKPSGIVYATIQYEDDRGSQSYEMTKDRIKIGRGANDCWVDLRLHSKQDISREHAQVRIDSSTGKFFIKDVSTYGTTVDGRRIPPSIERSGGEEVDKNIEVPLPGKARIGLAGVLELSFKAVRR